MSMALKGNYKFSVKLSKWSYMNRMADRKSKVELHHDVSHPPGNPSQVALPCFFDSCGEPNMGKFSQKEWNYDQQKSSTRAFLPRG
jgi:hypothetical protein